MYGEGEGEVLACYEQPVVSVWGFGLVMMKIVPGLYLSSYKDLV